MISAYEKLVKRYASQNQVLQPLLTWRLQHLNLLHNFYKESDPFYSDGITWTLFLKKEGEKEISVGIKYSQPFEDDENEELLFNPKEDQIFFKQNQWVTLLHWLRLEQIEPDILTQVALKNSTASLGRDPIDLSHFVISHARQSVVL